MISSPSVRIQAKGGSLAFGGDGQLEYSAPRDFAEDIPDMEAWAWAWILKGAWSRQRSNVQIRGSRNTHSSTLSATLCIDCLDDAPEDLYCHDEHCMYMTPERNQGLC